MISLDVFNFRIFSFRSGYQQAIEYKERVKATQRLAPKTIAHKSQKIRYPLHLYLDPQPGLIYSRGSHRCTPQQHHRPTPHLRRPVPPPLTLNQRPRNRRPRQRRKRQNRAHHPEARTDLAQILRQRSERADEDALHGGGREPIYRGERVGAAPGGDGRPAVDHEGEDGGARE